MIINSKSMETEPAGARKKMVPFTGVV